uniref:Putative pancreatic triacylglycerol lipase-like protein n=1 Tax=Pinctada fucata TaxID=50426 RepID=A0A194AQ58_PINFU
MFVQCVILLVSFSSYSSGFLFDDLVSKLDSQVCYGDLGCFGTAPPFRGVERPVDLLPKSPAEIQVGFWLHTRSNPINTAAQILQVNDTSSLSSSHFDASKETKFIVHGFTHNGNRQWLQNMCSEFLKKDDMNVIIVDWGHGSGVPYTQATANTRVVGALMAKMIKQLVTVGADLNRVHIIGHSLGAHIAGYAGERLDKLGRISGLDPADPYFQGTDTRVRLDPTDAQFVDVIHTDSSSILQLGMGAMQALGHVDFYPNGGVNQPGCQKGAFDKITHTVWNAVTQLDIIAAEGAVACSHERSYVLFTESINSNCPFRAYPCTGSKEFEAGHCLECSGDGCSEMGYKAINNTGRGSLYLDTAGASPFCDFHYLLNISGKNNFDGILSVTLQGSKGSSSPITLMQKNEVHTANHLISKFFKVNKDIGDVTGLTLHYEKTGNLLSGWAYPDDWQLLGLALYNAETKQTTRCSVYGKTVSNHQSASFQC